MDFQEALKTAIRGEIEGRELYKMISEKTDDPQAKEIFSFLSREEDQHFMVLKQLAYEWSEEKSFKTPEMKHLLSNARMKSPIFSDDFKNRIKDRHFEMSALSIGMKLEKDSFEFYGRMADQQKDPELKNLFRILSEWEKNHYDFLGQQIKNLEQAYFDENRFSPF